MTTDNVYETTLEKIQSKYRGNWKEVETKAQKLNAGFVVLYQNSDFTSSNFGAQTILFVGSNLTIKGPYDLPQWLNDLPSQRQYIVGWAKLDENI